MSDEPGQARPRRRRRGRVAAALLLILLFAAGWTALYGFFELAEGEVALISRRGVLTREVRAPGRHVHLPFPLERRAILTSEPQALPEGRVEELVTGDAQLVDAIYRAHYQVAQPAATRFAIRDPARVVDAALRAALVAIAASHSYDALQERSPAVLGDDLMRRADAHLALVESGLQVVRVELELAMPVAVTELETEIAELRAKRDHEVEEARAEGEALVAQARVRALEVSELAHLERDALVSKASGEAERFQAVAAEYRKAPEVVRTRIYLETMEAILGNAKVVIAAPGAPLPSAAAPSVPSLPSVSSDLEATE